MLRLNFGVVYRMLLFRNSGKCHFNLFQQHDASEIMSCILQELRVESFLVLRSILKNQVSCNKCFDFLSVICQVFTNIVEVFFHKKFSLIATVSHTGIPNRGHYTAVMKQPISSSWLFCNGGAIFRLSVEKIKSNSPYICEAILKNNIFLSCKGVRISFLVFRCDNPKHCPNHTAIF